MGCCETKIPGPRYNDLRHYPVQYDAKQFTHPNWIMDFRMDFNKPHKGPWIATVNGPASQEFGTEDRNYIEQLIRQRWTQLTPDLLSKVANLKQAVNGCDAPAIIFTILMFLTMGILFCPYLIYQKWSQSEYKKQRRQWIYLFIEDIKDFIRRDLSAKHPNLIFTIIYPICIYQREYVATENHAYPIDKMIHLYCYIRISNDSIGVMDSYEPAIDMISEYKLACHGYQNTHYINNERGTRLLRINEEGTDDFVDKRRIKTDSNNNSDKNDGVPTAKPNIVRQLFGPLTTSNAKKQQKQQSLGIASERAPLKQKDSGDSLPEGWCKLYTSDGRIYYQNNITQTTQWHRPDIKTDSKSDDMFEKNILLPPGQIDPLIEKQKQKHNNTEWIIYFENKQFEYDSLWLKVPKIRNGKVNGEQMKSVMQKSGLNNQILSDLDKDGQMGYEEFALCMYLMDKAKMGETMPEKLPGNYIPPSFRGKPLVKTPPKKSRPLPNSKEEKQENVNEAKKGDSVGNVVNKRQIKTDSKLIEQEKHTEKSEVDEKNFQEDIVKKKYPEIWNFITNKAHFEGDDAVFYCQLFKLNGWDSEPIIGKLTEMDLINMGVVDPDIRCQILNGIDYFD